MEVSEVKQRLLTDFFTYYPMGGALYDKNGALIDINKSLNEKFPFTNEADFLLNNLFSYRFVDRSSKTISAWGKRGFRFFACTVFYHPLNE